MNHTLLNRNEDREVGVNRILVGFGRRVPGHFLVNGFVPKQEGFSGSLGMCVGLEVESGHVKNYL